jgi:hypothetical protein
MFGLTVEEASPPPVEVWPDCIAAINLFCQIGSQWRMSQAGPYGLDYNVLYHKLDRMNLTPDEYQQMEDDIRTLETAALDAMRKDQK